MKRPCSPLSPLLLPPRHLNEFPSIPHPDAKNDRQDDADGGNDGLEDGLHVRAQIVVVEEAACGVVVVVVGGGGGGGRGGRGWGG